MRIHLSSPGNNNKERRVITSRADCASQKRRSLFTDDDAADSSLASRVARTLVRACVNEPRDAHTQRRRLNNNNNAVARRRRLSTGWRPHDLGLDGVLVDVLEDVRSVDENADGAADGDGEEEVELEPVYHHGDVAPILQYLQIQYNTATFSPETCEKCEKNSSCSGLRKRRPTVVFPEQEQQGPVLTRPF